MTDLRKAAEMALEALENSRVFVTSRKKTKHPEGTKWYDNRIEELRQALDYPTPEQIALAQQIRPKGKSRIGQALAQPEEWRCPIKHPDCKQNCGSYGCGN